MRRIRTKFAVAMAAVAAIVLAFTGVVLIINISVGYRNDFYSDVYKTVNKLPADDSIDSLYEYLDGAYEGGFYILEKGNIIKSSEVGGFVVMTDNLRALNDGGNARAAEFYARVYDYGVNTDSGYTVYFTDSKEQLHLQIRTFLWQLLQALILGILLAVVISWVLSKKMTRSIRTLEEGAVRMSEGEFLPIAVDDRDEIASLCDAFNRMGEQIQKDYDSFENEERARREFVANVSHELKTPLTVIKSYSQTLTEMEVDRDTQKGFLSIIDSEVDRMSNTVSQLLQLSRLEASTEQSEKIDLFQVCRDTASSLSIKISSKNIACTVTGAGAVTAPPSKVQTIITNIVDNAVKYTDAGGSIDIEISGKVLSVKNTGGGIAKEDIPHIFERFYRADKARTRKTGGTGLGLAIAKECADSIGAAIECDSVPLQYTTFTVRFI